MSPSVESELLSGDPGPAAAQDLSPLDRAGEAGPPQIEAQSGEAPPGLDQALRLARAH